jgi:hypothetical protein
LLTSTNGGRGHLSTFAYLLGRVALADHAVSNTERELMLREVAQEGSLTAEEAAAVVRLAIDEFRRLDGTHNLIVAREFAALTTIEERLALLRGSVRGFRGRSVGGRPRGQRDPPDQPRAED